MSSRIQSPASISWERRRYTGSSYLDGNELRTRALNWSDSLASRTNEAVRIGTLHDGQVLVVHHVFRPDDTRQVLELGELLPAHATALGKMLLAHHAYAAAECVKVGLPRYTASTIVDAEELLRHLATIKSRGWAADLEELVPDEAAYAAPIKDRRGDTVGAIGISGPTESGTLTRWLRQGIELHMCPLCRVAHKADREYIWQFSEEGFGNEETMQALARAHGFCAEHAEMPRRIDSEMKSMLGVSTT